MTKITILKKNNLIVGYQIKGHSGYAEEGSDIVCSAISVAGQMALVGLQEISNPKAEIKDGFLKVELEEESVNDRAAQVVLIAMEKTLKDIAKNYKEYVLMEVKKDVY